jgi:hypothetical protein
MLDLLPAERAARRNRLQEIPEGVGRLQELGTQ